jgi:HNH endonuclease
MKWKKYHYHYRVFEVNEKGQVRNEFGTMVTGTLHPNGFRVLNLRLMSNTEQKISKSLILHRIVAECFIENPESKPYVIHKDGNLLNNAAKNLAWVTPSEKLDHQKHLGRYGNAKLGTKEVLKIKRLLAKNEMPVSEIAKDFHVSHTQIHRIKKGENWQ